MEDENTFIDRFNDEFDRDGHLVHRKYESGYESWYSYGEDGKRNGMKDSNGYKDGVFT